MTRPEKPSTDKSGKPIVDDLTAQERAFLEMSRRAAESAHNRRLTDEECAGIIAKFRLQRGPEYDGKPRPPTGANDEAAARDAIRENLPAHWKRPPEETIPKGGWLDRAMVTALLVKGGYVPSPGTIGRGPGATAKFSEAGNFKGWYRTGQKAGKPSTRYPSEVEIDNLMRKTSDTADRSLSKLRRRHLNQLNNKKSSKSRSSSDDVEALFVKFSSPPHFVPKHQRATKIAKRLGLTRDRVGRIILAFRRSKP